MEARLFIDIQSQPDETTCGPTCLHAVYRYFGEHLSLQEVIRETRRLEGGGTLAVFLANHALRRGFAATIYTYNLQVFDPTWFEKRGVKLRERLLEQVEHKPQRVKLRTATRGYVEFLDLGGRLRFTDLTPRLIRGLLRRGMPILTGLSATFLYRTPREFGPNDDYDDVRGEPSGHFVLLAGYDRAKRTVLVADPMNPNPVSETHEYVVTIQRVINAILLGILTYDANLLIIQPRKGKPQATHVDPVRRQ